MSDREEAQKEIQRLSAEIERIFAQIVPLADEHKIEFSVLGNKMHYNVRYQKAPAKVGLFISEGEWESSTFECSSEYWEWYDKAFPDRNNDE